MVQAYHYSALYTYWTGDDPTPFVRKAEEFYEKSLSVNPEFPQIATEFSRVLLVLADYEMDHHRSPEELFARLDGIAGRVREIAPEMGETWASEADLALRKARWEASQNRSPQNFYEQAEASLRKAVALNSNNAKYALTYAQLLLEQARWLKEKHLPFESKIQEGLQQATNARAIDPENAEAMVTHARLLGLAGNKSESDTLLQTAFAKNPFLKNH
jgi:tetratricopeptide (TPR) repeat protein